MCFSAAFPSSYHPATSSPSGTQRGFTLVELMVVLLIVSVLIGMVVPALGSSSQGRALRAESEELAALIGLLADESMLDGRQYGIRFDESGYRALVYDEQRQSWRHLTKESDHRLPGWVRMTLHLEGSPLKLGGADAASASGASLSDDLALPEPQLLLLSSGELSVFELRLEVRSDDAQAYVLTSDGFRLPVAELAAP